MGRACTNAHRAGRGTPAPCGAGGCPKRGRPERREVRVGTPRSRSALGEAKKALRPPLTASLTVRGGRPPGRRRGPARGVAATAPGPAPARPPAPRARAGLRGPRPAGASVVKIATSSTRVTDCACRSEARLLMFFHKKGGDRGGGFIRGAPGYGTYQLRGAAHGTRQRPALRRLFTLMGLSGPRPGPTPVCGVRRSASGHARWRAAGSPVSLTPCLLMSIRIGPQTGRPVCPFSPGLHPWRSRGAGGPQA